MDQDAAARHLCFDPRDPAAPDPYDLLVHAVAPRPIALVSTLSAAGVPNLAPFSYFMAGGSNPPSVAFSPNTRADGGEKDTLRNVRETGEFVVHIVTFAQRDGVNAASRSLPAGESEWPLTGFTPVPARRVRPPRVLESPFALECRLHAVVPHGQGPDAANYVIGEVLCFHVARDLWSADGVDAPRVDYLARLGADWYLRALPQALFRLPRPG